MAPPYWPVALENAGASMYWHQVSSGNIVELPDQAIVRVLRANHPNSSVIYRLEKGDKHIVYGLDYELTLDCRSEYEDFVKDCSLLIFDGMYTDEERPKYRGFGHSSWEQGIKIMETCNIQQLCISHHDWGRSDSELERIEQNAKRINSNCMFARENMIIHFE